MTILHVVIYKVSSMLINFNGVFSKNIKFTRNLKGPLIAKRILKKKIVESLTLPDFRTYYKATISKTMWYWHNDRCKPVD